MKIIVNGALGHMGAIVCDVVREGVYGAELAARVDRCAQNGTEGLYAALTDYTGKADCVIDFSNHAGIEELLAYCVERELPVVVATTGHTAEEKEKIFEASKHIPVFFSGNMSVGVAVLCSLAQKAAAMYLDADIEIIEKHHNRKLDVPSGTALMLAESIRKVREEAEFNIGRHTNGKRQKNEIGIHSLRYGNEVGTHEVIISNGSETLTLKHEAENRSLFARGAVTAASFITGKDPGLYAMGDIMK